MTPEIKEAADSALTDELQRRIRSPYYGSLAISFAILNWNSILLILYPSVDWPLLNRMLYVKLYYQHSAWNGLLLLVVGPILGGALATSVFPWVINILDDLRDMAMVWKANRHESRTEKLRANNKKITDLTTTLATTTAELGEVKNDLTRALRETTRVKQQAEYFKKLEDRVSENLLTNERALKILRAFSEKTRVDVTAEESYYLTMLDILVARDGELSLGARGRHLYDNREKILTEFKQKRESKPKDTVQKLKEREL